MAEETARFRTDLEDGVSKSAKKQASALAKLRAMAERFQGGALARASRALRSMSQESLRFSAGVARGIARDLQNFTRPAVERLDRAFTALGTRARSMAQPFQRAWRKASDSVARRARQAASPFQRAWGRASSVVTRQVSRLSVPVSRFARRASGQMASFGQRASAAFTNVGRRISSAFSQTHTAKALKGFARVQARGVQFGRTLGPAVAEVRSNLTALGSTASSAFGKISSSARKGLGKAAKKMKDFAKSAALVGAAIAGAIVGGVTMAAVKMTDFAQRSKLALGLVATGSETAQGLFDRSIALAQQLGLDVVKTTKNIQKFRALQFNQQQAEALVKMGADMRALGANTEEVQRIMLQLGQIQAKGRLQGEELIVLAENGLSTGLVLEALAKRAGKSIDEIQKDLSSGSIKAADALNAIGEAIKKKTGIKKFGDAGRAMATSTLSGMAGLLKSRAQGIFVRIGEQLEKTLGPAMKEASLAIEGFLDGGGQARIIDTIVGGVKSLVAGVRASIPFVKAFVGGFVEGFRELWPSLKGVAATLTETFGGGGGDWLTTLKDAGRWAGNVLVVAIGALGAALGGLMEIFRASVKLTNLVRGALTGIVDGLGALIFAIDDGVANMKAQLTRWADDAMLAAQNFISGLVNGIKNGVGMVVQAAKNLGASLLSGIKSTLGIASPSKEAARLGQFTAQGFQAGMNKVPLALPAIMPAGGAANDVDASATRTGGGAGGQVRGLGGAQISFSVHVTVQGGSNPEETGRRTADAIIDEVKARLPTLEDLALASGQ